jgi:hypothetical protein
VCGNLRGKNGNPAANFALQPHPNQDVLSSLSTLLNLLLKPMEHQEETIMATVIPADKFLKDSIYSFILRENPEKKGIEIHFPPDCQTDSENAITFIAKIMLAGFKQANQNPKLYYATYTPELIVKARSWVKSCVNFGAYELSPTEPVEKTPSRRRYGGSPTKKAVTTPAAPNKLLDALAPRIVADIALLLDNKVDPLAENIASCIVARLKSEHRDSQELDRLKAENAKLIAERDGLVLSSKAIAKTLDDTKSETQKEVEKLTALSKQAETVVTYQQGVIEHLQQECDRLRSQLQEFGLETESEITEPTFDDDSKPVFADESEESEPVFADESNQPKFDDEEEGFDLDALQEK